MARPSYGPEAKKRSHHLFVALLDYANDMLVCDEAVLDPLRPQIQTYWQTEQRLVVRTKVRFLEALTKLAGAPLSAEQIKEALRRFEDFLEILEDNRPNKGGSETWHFTLKLWHRRGDRPANFRQFEQEWENRRSPKSKQVTQTQITQTQVTQTQDPESAIPNYEFPTPNSFHLTINPLTVTDGITFDLHELYLPLGLVERKRQNRSTERSARSMQSDASEEDESEESEAYLPLEEFLGRLKSGERQRVAIVGEPGAGKTTLLQKIATWLLEQQALPIWISLADLQGMTLENYLLQDWLKQATRKISVPPELQETFAEQFRQGRVWLLLDAVDEMAIDAAIALSSLARQLRGWIADAHIVLTCRSNVWDSGKNALDAFTTYCNLSFSNGSGNHGDQVGQFIDRWFQHNPELGVRLRQALSDPKRRRIRDAVKNPLRLALLCRTWSLTQGTLPQTKALLYQQFVETIYEWKQDRFPTTLTQRHALNQALGQVALCALLQPETRFRLSHTFTQTAFADSLELMTLALQLGWLNLVGVSHTTGEKVYAFYHPTFQEYFAAQAIAQWQFFFDPADDFPVFSPHWREVVLLWLGRADIAIAEKENFIQALITFDDQCGGFYTHRAYFLAAAGLAEFSQCSQAEAILEQLMEWRFGIAAGPLHEGAKIAVLQTDRESAIAILEQFIQRTENPFTSWQAAYTLGKTLDPGNAIAIAALTQLINTLQNEPLRLQAIESLGKIDANHPSVMRSLEEMMASTQQDNVRRRAAYSLGKLYPEHPKAIATLEQMILDTTDSTFRLRTAENLIVLDPTNQVAVHALDSIQNRTHKKPKKHQTKITKTAQDLERTITTLEQRLVVAKDIANQRRIAHRLGMLQPGHPQAIACLVQLLLSENTAIPYKRIVEDLKEVLLSEQLAELVTQIKLSLARVNHPAQRQECDKLLSYCAQQMAYPSFCYAWSLATTAIGT